MVQTGSPVSHPLLGSMAGSSLNMDETNTEHNTQKRLCYTQSMLAGALRIGLLRVRGSPMPS